MLTLLLMLLHCYLHMTYYRMRKHNMVQTGLNWYKNVKLARTGRRYIKSIVAIHILLQVQALCNLQVKLCDPCLSALRVNAV